MSDLKKVGDLEINQNLDFRRKEVSFERWGWTVMLIVVLAGLSGLFGRGPVSNATVENSTLQVGYGRFERLLAPAKFNIQVAPEGAGDGDLILHVDRDLLDFYKIERITPDPDGEELSADHISYTFKVNPAEQPLMISFHLQSNKIGVARGAIGIEDGPAVQIRQLIYP